MKELEPAAEEVLAEYVTERLTDIREQVIRRADTLANGDRITALDLARAAGQISEPQRLSGDDLRWDMARNERRARTRRLLMVYAGITLGALVTLFAWQLGGIRSEPDNFSAVAASVAAGTSLAGVSIAYVGYRRARGGSAARYGRSEQERLLGRFLQAWAEFEVASRRATSNNNPRKTLLSDLRGLAKDGILSEAEISEVTQLLRMRNAIVHSADVPPPGLLDKWTVRLSELSDKVSRSSHTTKDAGTP